jgi:polyisoprenoid-binding protein YceI
MDQLSQGASMKLIIFVAMTAAASATVAAPVTYDIDPTHTFPSFEADHMGGMSVWRGKFTKSSGKVVLDVAAKTGSVDISIDPASISFGMEKLDEHVKSADALDVVKFPTATYSGTLVKFIKGRPTEVDGKLTLHGVTRPVRLSVRTFRCMPHPKLKKEFCGADAYATIKRDEFGVSYGKDYGFNMDVNLRIQVEGIKAE